MQEGQSLFALAEEPKQTVWPGLDKRPLAAGPRLRIDEFFFDVGVHADRHSHTIEEAGYIVAGEFEFQLGDESRRLGSGDAWSVPAGVEHAVKCVRSGSYVVVSTTAIAVRMMTGRLGSMILSSFWTSRPDRPGNIRSKSTRS